MKTEQAREQRRHRAALLRNPPRPPTEHAKRAEYIAILTELALIHDSPRISGAQKHKLFERGVAQLVKL